MRNAWNVTLIVFLMTMSSVQGQSTLNFKNLGSGWMGLTRQTDPFDKTKIQISQISKGIFTFRCEEINFEVGSYGYESLSFPAELKYVVDEQNAVDKVGKYSTYLGGSDLITNSRYYSARIPNGELQAFKSGRQLKMAGKYSSSGWTTRELALDGFASAYDEMCGQ